MNKEKNGSFIKDKKNFLYPFALTLSLILTLAGGVHAADKNQDQLPEETPGTYIDSFFKDEHKTNNFVPFSEIDDDYALPYAGLGNSTVPYNPETFTDVNQFHGSYVGCTLVGEDKFPSPDQTLNEFKYDLYYDDTPDIFWPSGHGIPVMSRIFNSVFKTPNIKIGCIDWWVLHRAEDEDVYARALAKFFRKLTELEADVASTAFMLPAEICHDPDVIQALREFTDQGGIFVPSSGNHGDYGTGALQCPANLVYVNNQVLPAGPAGLNNTLVWFAPKNDLGTHWSGGDCVHVLSSRPGEKYFKYCGSSFSAPAIATLVSQIIGQPKYKNLSRAEIVAMLISPKKIPVLTKIIYDHHLYLPIISKTEDSAQLKHDNKIIGSAVSQVPLAPTIKKDSNSQIVM